MNVSAAAKTDLGQRPNNEDHYAIVDTRRRGMRADGALIIADGMGGRSFGEQASREAVDAVEETLAEMLDTAREGEVVVGDVLASALRKANSRVYELARADDDRKGMGTTCVVAVVEGDRLYVAHAGDSRAYLLQGGALRQLTSDHSYVAEQVRAGAISEEGARRSRFRNIITRAVGIEPAIEAEVSEVEVRPGDMLLLCTDGLSNMVDEESLARTLVQSASPQAAADRLVQLAGKNGGKDNITAVVARLQAGTRTLRMQAADLKRPEAAAPEDGAEAAPEPARVVPPAAVQAPRRGSALWPLMAALLLAGGAGLSYALAHRMVRDGYRFQAASPFAVRPVPPAPPRPPDPAHVSYDSPKVFYFMPVRGSFLQVGAQDGAITAAALSGAVVVLGPQGGDQVRYKFRLPAIKPQAAAPRGALGAGGVTLHTATDPQGNLYVSDAVARTITKYQANGIPLGLVAHLSLINPQAIGAGPDGTVYVVDAERLKVLRAHPSTTPLPPIPVPRPPAVPVKPAAAPAAPVAPVPLPPVRRFRHYGYRRSSGGYRHSGGATP